MIVKFRVVTVTSVHKPPVIGATGFTSREYKLTWRHKMMS